MESGTGSSTIKLAPAGARPAFAAADLHPGDLHQAMRYAVLGGGKRIRPVLVYAAGAAVGAMPEALDGPACAVEFIHAYSLIHDDLPAMDNDDLRHGQPTCHRAFGEALAILAGDALQALAFQVLSQDAAMIADPAFGCGCWACWRKPPVPGAWWAVRRLIWRRSVGN
jgi:hypothetical protein